MSGKLTGVVVVVVKVLQSARGEWVPTAEISGPACPDRRSGEAGEGGFAQTGKMQRKCRQRHPVAFNVSISCRRSWIMSFIFALRCF